MAVAAENSDLKGVLSAQTRLIERVVAGEPLTDILESVTTWLENQTSTDIKAAVFMLNPDGITLSFKAGRRLAPDLVAALNSLPIGPENNTIAQAAYNNAVSFTENIENCESWKNYQKHTFNANLMACWAWPLVIQNKKAAGILAVFSTNEGVPDSQQIQLSELAVHNLQLLLSFSSHNSENQAPDNDNSSLHLKQTDEHFQNLVRNASIGIIVLKGRDMIVDVANEMYGRLINRTPEQLLNLPLFTVIPEAEETFRPLIENVLFTGKSTYLYEQPYQVTAEGKIIRGYLNIIYQPYRDSDGEIIGVMVLCHDITELVKARKKN